MALLWPSKAGLMLLSALISLLFAFGAAYPGLGTDSSIAVEQAATSDIPTLTITVSPVPFSTDSTHPADRVCNDTFGDLIHAQVERDIYQPVCNVDFPGQDIYPFLYVQDFDECLHRCTDYNMEHNDTQCLAFLFAPDRVSGADDCYLKSALANPQSATVALVGGIRKTRASAIAVASQTARSESREIDSSEVDHAVSSGRKFEMPRVDKFEVLGGSTNKPTKQYIDHEPYSVKKMDASLLVPGINRDLISKFPIAKGTGVWRTGDSLLKNHFVIKDMKGTPHLSRDGGKGGNINGTNIFIFCDTNVYIETEYGREFVDFVSSSVATDDGMNAIYGKPLTLVDQIGEWQDDVGRMRGFAPLTEGELAFNKEVSGDGFRYAVWPETSLIPLNKTHSIMYAGLVYDVVDMNTQTPDFQNYNLTYLGNTLLVVGVDETTGPWALRTVNNFFTPQRGGILWGSLGGFRAWGPQGPGGTDGEIFLFGKVADYSMPGVFAAKVSYNDYSDRTKYAYWTGERWHRAIQPLPNNGAAMVLNDTIQDLDIFFAVSHGDFVMIYTKPGYNKFFFRFMKPPQGIGAEWKGIRPAWYKGGYLDWAQIMVDGQWSQERVLTMLDNPPVGHIYSGGVHAGYFGDDDITQGGNKMLLTWTERTGQAGESDPTGYIHKAATVTWHHEQYDPGS